MIFVDQQPKNKSQNLCKRVKIGVPINWTDSGLCLVIEVIIKESKLVFQLIQIDKMELKFNDDICCWLNLKFWWSGP